MRERKTNKVHLDRTGCVEFSDKLFILQVFPLSDKLSKQIEPARHLLAS